LLYCTEFLRGFRFSILYGEFCYRKAYKIYFTFCFANPGSITKTTPSIVRDVSAIFVETTTFRPMAPLDLFGGAGSKIRC
jgi:hypothetical protein